MSLRTKIVLTILLTVFFSSVALAGAFLVKSRNLALQVVTSEIKTQADLISARFSQFLEMAVLDASAVAHVSGQGETGWEAFGVNATATDTEPEAVSLERLETLYMTVIREKPYYTQIRLIGLEQNGQELLRINQTPYGLVSVAPDELQQKGDEPYFQEALAFFQQDRDVQSIEVDHEHEVYFSEITLNREHGVVSEPKTATLRVISPLYASGGALFGFVVINIDYEQLVGAALRGLNVPHVIYLTNENFDFITSQPGSMVTNLEFHSHYTEPVPEILRGVTIHGGSAVEKSDGMLAVQSRFTVNNDPTRFFAAIVAADQYRFLDGVEQLGQFGFGMAAFLVLMAALVALVFSKIITAPLNGLTEAVTEAERTGKAFDFPYTKHDEIGVLTREMTALSTGLIESEAKMRKIVNGIGEGVILLSHDGQIVDTNAGLDEIFGYRKGALLGKNIRAIIPKLHRRKLEAYMEKFGHDNGHKVNWYNKREVGRRKTGEAFSVEVTMTEMLFSDEVFYIGILRDISELEAAEKMKAEFIATISHELRTPLTSIIGSLKLLKATEGAQLNGNSNALLASAERNSDRLRGLVEDLLDFGAYSAGKKQLNKERVNVAGLLQQEQETATAYAQKFGVSVVLEEGDQNTFVEADAKLLSQALSNLINNAIKFSHKGDAVRLSQTTLPDRNILRISVQDTGAGIPEKAMNNIFMAFRQVDSSDSRSSEGVGLGLAIVKSIVDAHNGDIKVTSEVGRGSTFMIDLPLAGGHSQVAA